jgi:hypothetical protein
MHLERDNGQVGAMHLSGYATYREQVSDFG